MRQRKGSALVTVLLTFTVLSILAVALISVVMARMKLAVSYEDSTGAVYAAQAGLEKMKLDIRNLVTGTAFQVNIHNYVQNYIDLNPGATDTQLKNAADNATEQYLYTNYLSSLPQNQLKSDSLLSQKTTFYEILPFSNTSNQENKSYYDKANGRIIIRSIGTYGRATKTIALTLQLDSRQDTFTDKGDSNGGWQNIPGYSVIIDSSTSNQYAFKAYCRSLNVKSSFYLPRGMDHVFSSADNFSALFEKDFTVNDNLDLEAYAQQFTVKNDMKINGNLTLGATSMRLTIQNGDLVVNGNIIINGYNDQINILNGSLRCRGNIIFNSKDGTSSIISVSKDLHLAGTVTLAYNCSVKVSGATYRDYGGTIASNPPINPVSSNVFTSNPNVIKTNSINANRNYGSPSNPVVIYSDGDLNINNPWNSTNTTINIYGLVYSKGKITITGYGGDTFFNMYGVMVSEKEIEINDYHKAVNFTYDGSNVMANLSINFPDIISNIYSSYNSAPETRNVYVTDDFTQASWDE